MIKIDQNNNISTLSPKFSLRYNPTNMKNHSSKSRSISVDNIFSLNRLGIDDSFESGRSLTLGIDYKKIMVKVLLMRQVMKKNLLNLNWQQF